MLIAALPDAGKDTSALLSACGLSSRLELQDGEDVGEALHARWLPAARVCSLSASDSYYFEPPGAAVISPVNEAAALGLLLHVLRDNEAGLAAVKATCCKLPSSDGVRGEPCSDCASLIEAARGCGVVTSLTPALFAGLRGAAASHALQPGDIVAEVPATALLTAATARACTRLAPVLESLGAVDDVAVLLWTMLERADKLSAHAAMLALNGASLGSALTMPEEALRAVEGTAMHAEAMKLRDAARTQYDSLFPALLVAWQNLLSPASAFTFEHYLAAVELWQAYGMKVQLPGTATPQTALMPFVCLLNHSAVAPHVVRFSQPDADGVFRLRTVRPCAAGCEVTLSYGALSNSHLLLYYGFTVPDNPCDAVEFQVDTPFGDDDDEGEHHQLRAACPLPWRLLETLRLLCAPSPGEDGPEGDAAALAALSDVLAALSQGMPPPPTASTPALGHIASIVSSQHSIVGAAEAECRRRQLLLLPVII